MPTPKGSKLSPEHRRKISEGLKNSEKYKAGIRNRKLINPFEGHNYGECNKCGKTHTHPMKGKHHSEETKRKISNANRGKKRTLEQRQKLSKALKGRTCKGKHLSSAHKLNIARGVRNSKLFHERVREYHRRRTRENEEEVKVMEKKLGVHCIVITATIMKRLVRDSPTHQVLCYRCTGLFKIGDIVVPKHNSRRHGKRTRKFYHPDCWESMFFE